MSTAVLNQGVLVLNKYFQAVQVTSVRRAFSLFFKGYVKAVDEGYITYEFNDWKELPVDDEDNVRTPSAELRLPRVVQLVHYDKVPSFRIRLSRKNIYMRDKHTCQYCGKRFDEKELTLDHIMPISRGGGNSWENLATSCFRCNNTKGNRTPAQAGMKLRSTPKQPQWLPFSKFTNHRNGHPMWKTFIDFAYFGFPE